MFGTASVTALVATSAVLVGCEDESQPDYWVKRLDDPAKRAPAVKRLTQFYEDGMTKANGNREAPEMKALLAKIVKPMSDAYVKGDLDEKTRVELLKALAGTRDPAAKDAIVKAIKDFAAGKALAEEMTQSATYVKQLKVQEASGPLLDAFLKIRVSDPKLGPPYIATQDAMMAVPDQAWKAKLIDVISKPVDPKNVPELRCEIYWQTVSALLLGELKAAEAVKPLFKVVLTADKKEIGPTAVVALTKIGKPTVLPVLDALTGKDAEMVEYAKKVGAGGTYVATSAIVLGTIGRGEALTPLIAALNSATDDGTRAVIGREMSKLPSSPDAIKTLQSVFEKVGNSALIPPGDPARVVMAESAGDFMDSSIVPWLLKQVDMLGKGSKEQKDEIDAIQSSLLQTAMKVMKKEQIDDVKKSVDKEGGDLDKAAFKRAADVLNACGDKVGCYLEKLEDPKVQEKNEQFTGIKSAFMLGMLGKDDTKAEIVKRLPKIKNAAIKFVSVKAIDRLSPNGDVKTADELQKIVDADQARGDQNAIAANSPIKQYIPRLRARAQ